MIALFGSKWTSQFGESVDPSGQWAKTLEGLTRGHIANGLEVVRNSGRAWPPTAPEFRSMCAHSDMQQLKSVDQAVAELHRYLEAGTKDKSWLSPEVYHTMTQNTSEHILKQLPYDKCDFAFRSAYRATLEDYRQGYELVKPPAPETLIEKQKPPELTPEQEEEARAKAADTIRQLKAMFDEPAEE